MIRGYAVDEVRASLLLLLLEFCVVESVVLAASC